MTRVLLVEDDRQVVTVLRRVLGEDGLTLDVAASGAEGLTFALAHDYDALVLDLGLPDGSGLSLLRELRERHSPLPVLILTGNSAPDDVVRGLDAGADDYVAKPFTNAVLKARLRTLVRRRAARRSGTLVHGALRIDRLARQVQVAGTSVRLTPLEFRLIEQLALHAEEPVSRESLLQHVWGMGFDPQTNVADVLVLRLRRKLGAAGQGPRIVAVRGSGYKLTDHVDDGPSD